MNEANDFLDIFSSIKDSPDFWRKYSEFTKNISDSDVEKLVLNIPDIIAKIKNDGASYELYNHLFEACKNDINFGKQLYEQIILSNCENTLSIIHTIVSGASYYNFKWAKEKVLELLESSNQYKQNQAISSIALFNFPKKRTNDFTESIDKKFNEVVKSEESDEILASIIFACRNQRNNIPSADQIILSLLKVETPKVKTELLNFLRFNKDLDLNEEFYKRILESLVSLDVELKSAYSSLSYRLKEKLDDHFPIIKNFFNSWISHSKENARNIKLLKPIFDDVYNSRPKDFQEIITKWLNDDSSNFHIAIFALMREMSYENLTHQKLDSQLVQQHYGFNDIEYVVRKVIGYVLHHQISTSLLYSVLEIRYNDEKVVSFVGAIFVDYLIFNYYSTIDFLKAKKNDTNGLLNKIISEIIEEGEKYYSAYKDLEVLKEFEPSESRLNYMNKIQSRKFTKSYERHDEKKNSLLNLFTTLHFRAGKTAFGKFNGEYSEPMQPKLISHSAELPRGEYIDPTSQAQFRLECQNFTRRK